MPDMLVLAPLLLAVGLFAGAALASRSILLSVAAAFPVLGYVSVKSGNTLMLGVFLLTAFFMVMGSGVYLTQTVIGETA